MIDYIKGDVEEITPASATIEAYGIGYDLSISLNTYSALTGKKTAKLYVHEAIREDAYQLFGFSEKHERELFRQLISVSGIGLSTGRMMLSSMTPNELASAIAAGDVDTLKTVKGIGAKTAQRVIVDLRDRIKLEGDMQLPLTMPTSPTASEATAALVMLGFAQKPSEKMVAKIAKENAEATVEQIIKIALKLL